MKKIIFMVSEAPEGGSIARALGESIYNEADDLESLSWLIFYLVKNEMEVFL